MKLSSFFSFLYRARRPSPFDAAAVASIQATEPARRTRQSAKSRAFFTSSFARSRPKAAVARAQASPLLAPVHVPAARPQALRPAAVSAMFTQNQSTPSAAWASRSVQMATPGTFAEAPEVQAAAHLFGARIRVYMPNGSGTYALQTTANPAERSRTLDLVLEGQHYRWVKGSVTGNSFSAKGATAAAIQNVPGDGNCFFYSIARGLSSAPSDHRAVRTGVVSMLRRCEQVPLDGAEGMTLGLAAGL